MRDRSMELAMGFIIGLLKEKNKPASANMVKTLCGHVDMLEAENDLLKKNRDQLVEENESLRDELQRCNNDLSEMSDKVNESKLTS